MTVTHIYARRVTVVSFLAYACALPAEPTQFVTTSFQVPLNRPLLCSITTESKFTTQRTDGTPSALSQSVGKDEYQFVDVVLKSYQEGREAARSFVKRSSTLNGHVTDSVIVGATAFLSEKKGKVSVRVSEGRRFLKQTMDRIAKENSSIGIWLQLPSQARVGSAYSIDLMPVAYVLLGCNADVETADSTMTLESFDAGTGTAIFRGRAHLQQKVPDKGESPSATMDYRLEGEIHVSPLENRILLMAFKGSVSGEITARKKTAILKGTLALQLRTAVGEEADRATKTQPKTGTQTIQPRGLGVVITLPSYYDGEDAQPPKCEYQCIRTIDADEGTAGITLRPMIGDTKAPKTVFDDLEKEITKSYPTAKAQDVSCALGNGRAYIFTVKSERGKEMKIRAEVYPLESTFLMYRLDASPTTFDVAEKEFIAARKTLSKGTVAP
jgi:hypothetical protein